ncbi:hypothetical protein DFO50_11171 [Microvirgula sp. AG722]|nr:hypothetical protein DFO50_11171 [Microvirgula sp. AG722]
MGGDYRYIAFMPKPDGKTTLENLAQAFAHYNEHYPRSVLGYRSPREFRRLEDSSI